MEKREEIVAGLQYFMNENLEKIICSKPRQNDGFIKMTVRPLLIQGQLKFQLEEFTKNQAFHKNMDEEEALAYICGQLESLYQSCEVFSGLGSMHVLISKKHTVTVKLKKKIRTSDEPAPAAQAILSHNRKKQYVLEEGVPVPFLAKLGIMTEDGVVIKSKYDKFRQINRYLEYIEDILPRLNKNRENVIIDFGCGKSYLTFAMYYYLHELKEYPVKVVGLDLKKDVIALCNRLSEDFGFEKLHFYHGDIAGYEGVSHVDMVVTLHACDTATDYAIAKAVKWGADVILTVPCCQHEVNGQIQHDLLAPVLKYGLLKERISALLTDGIRAELLEQAGYKTQVLEFIDMEHTPKNIMIRAVKQGKKKKGEALDPMMREMHLTPTLYRLLQEENLI